MAAFPSAPTAGIASLRLALVLLGACGLVIGLVQLVTQLNSGRAPAWGLVAFLVVSWLYWGSGLIAWWRRPSNRIGPLLVIGGLIWFASNAANSAEPALVAFGTVLATAPLVLVIHLLHAFPSGRLRTRARRLTVAAGWFTALVLQVPLYLFGDTSVPGDLLHVADRPDLAALGDGVQRIAGAGVIVVTAVMLARRLRSAASGQRRVLAPVFGYGILALLSIPLIAQLASMTSLPPLILVGVQLLMLAGVPVAFVLGVLRGAFARTGEIEELAALLGRDNPGHDFIAAALAKTLGDPSVALVFPVSGHHVDPSGRPIDLQALPAGHGVADIVVASRPVASIVYDATLIPDPELVRTAGRTVGLALDRERLTAELLASREELRQSRVRLVKAADQERRRITRDLHDGLQVRLVLLGLNAQEIASAAAEPATAKAATSLRAGIDEAAAELRALVHAVLPPALIERGLSAATEDLVDRLPMLTRLDLAMTDGELPAAVESTAYFVVAEGLANTLKYAKADEVTVSLRHDQDRLLVEVSDNGIGGAAAAGGSGLRGLYDRVDTLGGWLRIDSPEGRGTRLSAELPCAS